MTCHGIALGQHASFTLISGAFKGGHDVLMIRGSNYGRWLTQELAARQSSLRTVSKATEMAGRTDAPAETPAT